MIANFYTKPLQGSLFRKMRNYIRGLSDSLNEERVENRLNLSLAESENVKPSLKNKNPDPDRKVLEAERGDRPDTTLHGTKPYTVQTTYADIVKRK